MIGLRNPRDLVAGLVLLLAAGAILWFGRELPIGQATRLGPGYVPRALAFLNGLLGIWIAVRALVRPGERPAARWNLAGVGLVLAAILLFALLLQRLGLGAAAVALLLTASLAAPDFKPVQAIVFALALTILSVMVFVWGLGLNVKIFPW